MHVIVQAGGKGTRLEGLTRNRPKCLVPVNNKPLIFWAFEAFKNHDLKVICDYKSDVLIRYLDAWGKHFNAQVVPAGGTGTASGIANAIAGINDNDPIVVLWCDLLLNENFEIPSFILDAPLTDNYIGLSNTFPCRWSFVDSEFKHEASSETGVAGFFVFKNKQELEGIPTNGALVPWLQKTAKKFKPFILENVTEVGTMKAFEAYTKPAICRPFNDVQLTEETVTKRGIDSTGQKIAVDEIAWYKHVSEKGFSAIPKIFSYEPLVMERIKGRNIWEYNCLTTSEKKTIIAAIVDNLKELHGLEPSIPAIRSDLEENYLTKTFERLAKVEELVPFAKDEFIRINGRYYKNIFYDRDGLRKVLEAFYPSEFHLIHGDSTFSNMLYDRVNKKAYLIDPRGYFGKTKLFGDVDYDWAKVYYSLMGDYDQFNRKKFSLSITDKEVELAILSNNWADMEDYFFECLPGVSKTKIRALHAIIWLSLTTYAWEDYDSICGAFYNGIMKSADFI